VKACNDPCYRAREADHRKKDEYRRDEETHRLWLKAFCENFAEYTSLSACKTDGDVKLHNLCGQQ